MEHFSPSVKHFSNFSFSSPNFLKLFKKKKLWQKRTFEADLPQTFLGQSCFGMDIKERWH
jgi:hypothetical protein